MGDNDSFKECHFYYHSSSCQTSQVALGISFLFKSKELLWKIYRITLGRTTTKTTLFPCLVHFQTGSKNSNPHEAQLSETAFGRLSPIKVEASCSTNGCQHFFLHTAHCTVNILTNMSHRRGSLSLKYFLVQNK